MKKPGAGSRWAGLRIQVHGFRTVCSKDKKDVVRRELEACWQENPKRKTSQWLQDAEAVISGAGCKDNSWGGHRYSQKECLTPVQEVPQAALPLANGSQKSLPQASTAHVQKLPKMKGYEIVSRIGGGSYGDVYKAQIKDLAPGEDNATIALKVLHKRSEDGRKTQEQNRELSLLRELKHPTVMKLLGWRETHFNLQLMMPLYEVDLHHYANNGIDETEAQIFAGCLLDAVHYLHARSVIHRDIKPGNILVQRKPMAAILGDFGAARKLLPHVAGGDNEGLSVACCTRWFAAPEVLLCSKAYGFPSDIWSLGIT